tara:strand:+ start:252 stop:641 length:390 start_codon:yes stop_codon:yes gene_type:complete
MSKNKQTELINDAYRRLVWAFDNIDWRHYATELLDLERGYEKRHREYANAEYVFNPITCSKYWCVHHIFSALNSKEEPSIKGFLHLKQSVFYAHSLVANYRERIEKEFEGFDIETFNKINIVQWKEEVA